MFHLCGQLDVTSSTSSSFREKLSFPPTGNIARAFLFVTLLLSFWAFLWSLVGPAALPGGNLFALLVLWTSALLSGYFARLCHLPELLGMLIMGFVLRNVPYIDIAHLIHPNWSSAIRGIALAVILVRAGLGLDPRALKKLSFACFRLTFFPCLSECVTVALVSHLVLEFPLLWGFILGFVLTAVSTAVVVPMLLSLQENGFGVSKGIPTLILASAGGDNVLAIIGFGIVLGVTFSTRSSVMMILQGPLEIFVGLLYGFSVGFLLWCIPEKTDLSINRTTLLFLLSVFAVLGSRAFHFASSGPLACLILSFIASFKWRKDDSNILNQVRMDFSLLWTFFQPFLFALIGSDISISSLQPSTIGFGALVLLCGSAVRFGVTFLSTSDIGYTWKEKLFVSIAWLSKASVQAAIGPVALEYAKENNSEDEVILATHVLTLAVLSIVITAPVGAAAVSLSGPKLLKSGDSHFQDLPSAQNDAFDNIHL